MIELLVNDIPNRKDEFYPIKKTRVKNSFCHRNQRLKLDTDVRVANNFFVLSEAFIALEQNQRASSNDSISIDEYTEIFDTCWDMAMTVNKYVRMQGSLTPEGNHHYKAMLMHFIKKNREAKDRSTLLEAENDAILKELSLLNRTIKSLSDENEALRVKVGVLLSKLRPPK